MFPRVPPLRCRYRAYLTKEQVVELVAQRPETLELVNSWLEHHSISSSSISMTHGGNTLMLKGVSVTQANTLLGASHVERGETIVRTVGYSLPRALHRHVLTVAPTTSFVSPRTQWQTPRNRSDREAKSTSGEPATMLSSRAKVNSVTPSFLRWLYDTETYTPNTRSENVLGIVGFLGEYPTRVTRKYRSEADDATFTVVEVNGGGYDLTHPNEEANMDIQHAEAMAYPTPHIFYSTGKGPSGTDNYLVSWLKYILDQGNILQTISISYNNEEHSVPRKYAIYVCDQFAKLGLRGVSVLVSSGNDGIGEGTCLRNDGTVWFEPTFPRTCPYVTVAAADFSGGRFSDYFERPSYQEEAVSTFLQDLGNQYQGLYNASGRGIPDIGRREPLGFLNPWLYGRGFRGLDDITEGSNPGCGTDGFSPIVGWDPVTGLGTPNFHKMLF
ncbi:subtilisin-like protein [Lactarius hengduanensis]|nr:subtilisin-like protein [Lactarius hengduanensis]